MTESKPKQIPPYGIRIPSELKDRIKAAADEGGRSLHGEIIHALEEKYPPKEDAMLFLMTARALLVKAMEEGDGAIKSELIKRANEALDKANEIMDGDTTTISASHQIPDGVNALRSLAGSPDDDT